MRNILLFSNCNDLYECLDDKLKNTAQIAKVKFEKNQQCNKSIYSVYDLILIHFSENYYSNALHLVDDLRNLNFGNYIFILDHINNTQKEELLQLQPNLLLDLTTTKKESIYNLQSFIKKYTKAKESKNQSNKRLVNYTHDIELFSKKIKGLNKQLSTIKNTRLDSSSTDSTKDQLSNREMELFYHLLKGKTSKQISIEMKIEQSTVATFKSRLFKKIEVDSVVELVHYAYKNQLID